MSYLRNPLAWHKRYVEKVIRHAHHALGRSGACVLATRLLSIFISGLPKEAAIALGFEYLRNVPDFELNFGAAKGKLAQKEKRKKWRRNICRPLIFIWKSRRVTKYSA